MSDPLDSHSPAESASVEVPTPRRSTRKRRAKTPQPPKRSKRLRQAASAVRVKVGGHTIAMPKSLATKLTAKDKKKLSALFKRVVKRDKKRDVKKAAAKKR